MTFEEFYKSLGLKEYPFTVFTTELEQDKAKELFEPSTEYGPMMESFIANRSIIVLGERGVGKTAVKEDFVRNSFDRITSLITNFEKLSIPPEGIQVYKLILTSILNSIFDYITKKPLAIFRLTKSDKVYLSFLIYHYSDEDSLQLMKTKIETVQHNLVIRLLNAIYNNTRVLANYAGTVLENGLKRYIAQNFGLLQYYDESIVHEFFPEYKLKTIDDFTEREINFGEIEKIADLAARLSQKKPCIIFDSIDEDSRIRNDEDTISSFIESLLSDTKLLSCPKLQLVYFIWSTPYRFVIDSIRSQKFYVPTIKWDNDHLVKVLNTRLKVFSENEICDFKSISEKQTDSYEEIFEITNGVPRDLWHYMNKVFEEQYSIDKNSELLTIEAYKRALMRIVKETNYYEYYPRKSNARADSMDIYSYFGYLQKMKKIEFSKSQFRDEGGAGSSATNYLINMERIGLVVKYNEGKNQTKYRIKDKKIVYAVLNNIDIRNKD